MTITQLEYIIAVDVEKNFAKAASECNVTQPTLSMQIKKLEEELEVVLFDRTKKPVKTTEIGKILIEQGRKVVSESYRIAELINDFKGVVSGKLRIGIIPTLAPYLLPLFITDFSKKYDDIQITVDELMTCEIIDRLNKDYLDVGILVTPINESGIVTMPLFYELFVLYVNKNHLLAQQNNVDYTDLDKNEIWLLNEGHCFRHQSLNLCADTGIEKKRSLQFESGSLETLKKLVDSNSGYTLLPELATLSFTEEEYEHVRNFNQPQPVREVSFAMKKGYIKRKLIDLLKDNIQAHIPQILLNQQRGKRVSWIK